MKKNDFKNTFCTLSLNTQKKNLTLEFCTVRKKAEVSAKVSEGSGRR